MDFKKKKKEFSRFLAFIGLVSCAKIINITPWRFLYPFAKGIAAFGYAVIARQRKIALESLRMAFPDKTQAEIEKIARDSFTFMSKASLELMFMMDKPWLLKERITIANKEKLDQALAKKRGVILVSGHFGNFPIMLGKLSLEGYAIGGIMRPMHDARVEKIFLEKREKYKVKTIYSYPKNVCVDNTIKALRNNEIIFLPIDQNFGTSGVFVDFFGRKAATATGPVIFAQRTRAVLLPCFILRQADDTHKIIFDEEVPLIEGKNSQDTIILNVQRLTDIIERYIRMYPQEWGWIHRRWKSQPPVGK
ncbi:MAG: lysophospholipid acyltransferase family protein [Candidatus Omnitrophica bacterium]|jgi:KDO2-lipid IV(A) lauroyltransferase|nr:lysophospholipid acyltransferase family protein [Candidatus Omnitrophota bacterium]